MKTMSNYDERNELKRLFGDDYHPQIPDESFGPDFPQTVVLGIQIAYGLAILVFAMGMCLVLEPIMKAIVWIKEKGWRE